MRTEHERQDEEQVDVVVVGFGGAGACAAIEAADSGARVLALDRFEAGGATRRSGGVIYLGGGSATQQDTGFVDSPAQMLAYLERETDGCVPAPVLRRFCEESLANLRWLEGHGLDFPPRFFAGKATQPPDGFGIYYSGNERQYQGAAAAPRGHLPSGRGMAGSVLFEALRRAALQRGVELRERTRALRLLLEGDRVVGVEVLELPASPPLRALHRALAEACVVERRLAAPLERLERRGRRYRVRARGGVILAAGGFVFNLEMMRRHAPGYARSMPLGTAGDDGAGIRLGQSAGAAVASMSSCAAWRFYCPPSAFARGLLVNARGERVCDESLYGATLAREIVAQPDGAAYLIVDAAVARQAVAEVNEERLRDFPLAELLGGKRAPLMFAKLNTFVNLHLNRRRGGSLAELERRCGMPVGALQRTVAAHSERAARGEPDPLGKPREYATALREPPFLAIDCRLGNKLFLDPCLTLGGLRVDHDSAGVLREDGAPIPGLFAAGRTAAGICARSYVSGLSIADCIFSGRNAGRSAARGAGATRA